MAGVLDLARKADEEVARIQRRPARQRQERGTNERKLLRPREMAGTRGLEAGVPGSECPRQNPASITRRNEGEVS